MNKEQTDFLEVVAREEADADECYVPKGEDEERIARELSFMLKIDVRKHGDGPWVPAYWLSDMGRMFVSLSNRIAELEVVAAKGVK